MSASVSLEARAGENAALPPLADLMTRIGRQARHAARTLALTPGAAKARALLAAAACIRQDARAILAQNALDLADARAAARPSAFMDRLMLDPGRIDAIAGAVESVAALTDPVGRLLATIERPNGLVIERVATPLGVVGVIFESRPNVTVDAAALCLMAGNACILRAGSETLRTATALADAFRRGILEAGLPADAVQLVPVRDRDAVGLMLAGLDGAIDVIVPRGGRSLVERVQADARVPVFAHLDGLCHVYVAAGAALGMARQLVVNAKMRRTGICGAAETLLVDRAVAATHLGPVVQDLLAAGCEVRGDAAAQAVDPRVRPAAEQDWATEYLDAIIACRVVDSLDEALAHIERWGSHHTDCIVTDDAAEAERFLAEVDSAIVLHNASTQFADGGSSASAARSASRPAACTPAARSGRSS